MGLACSLQPFQSKGVGERGQRDAGGWRRPPGYNVESGESSHPPKDGGRGRQGSKENPLPCTDFTEVRVLLAAAFGRSCAVLPGRQLEKHSRQRGWCRQRWEETASTQGLQEPLQDSHGVHPRSGEPKWHLSASWSCPRMRSPGGQCPSRGPTQM